MNIKTSRNDILASNSLDDTWPKCYKYVVVPTETLFDNPYIRTMSHQKLFDEFKAVYRTRTSLAESKFIFKRRYDAVMFSLRFL